MGSDDGETIMDIKGYMTRWSCRHLVNCLIEDGCIIVNLGGSCQFGLRKRKRKRSERTITQKWLTALRGGPMATMGATNWLFPLALLGVVL